MMLAIERLGCATAEQLARAFFNSTRSAYEALIPLVNRRFLAVKRAPTLMVRSAVCHTLPPRNPVYILDWNGYYYLTAHKGYRLGNWRPSTVALVTSRFGHTIGISEIWSYLIAAARATHDIDLTDEGVDLMRYRLMVHFRNERAAIFVQRRGLHSTPRNETGGSFLKMKGSGVRVLLQPDGAFTLGIREMCAGVEGSAGHEPMNRSGVAERSHCTPSPRWDPTLSSWEYATLMARPSAKTVLQSEESVRQGAGSTYYRTLLLEMETGANSSKDVVSKIEAYNRLLSSPENVWTSAYGLRPRVLVVVRTDAQAEAQAATWRAHYFHKAETAVLVASLQTLARVYGYRDAGRTNGRSGRRNLLEERCWLDAMVGNSTWKTLGEALKLGVTRRKLNQAAEPTLHIPPA